jgi:hypothetical protein
MNCGCYLVIATMVLITMEQIQKENDYKIQGFDAL